MFGALSALLGAAGPLPLGFYRKEFIWPMRNGFCKEVFYATKKFYKP